MLTVLLAISGLLGGIAAEAAEPVAILGAVKGQLRRGDGAVLQAFDWMQDGESFEAGTDCEAIVVMTTGKRFQFAGPGKIQVRANGVQAERGKLKALSGLPPMPALRTSGTVAGTRAAAVRIRGKRGGDRMSPGGGASVLVEEAILRYREEGSVVRKYRFEIEDGQGKIIFEQESDQTQARVPTGVLSAGAEYTWFVWGRRGGSETLLGWEQMRVLTEAEAEMRRKWREQMGSDVVLRESAQGLMEALDRKLGLAVKDRR